MEITKNQVNGLNKLDNFFSQWEKNSNRGEYFANYYQQNKEQIKRVKAIRYQAQQLGLKVKVVNGVIAGEPITPLTKSERNQNHYLKQKQNRFFFCHADNHPKHIIKEIDREKKQATKIELRLCGRKTCNICNILREKQWRKCGRKKTGNALTSTERSRKRREFLKLIRPPKWNRLILKMLDNSQVRIETKKKVPVKKGVPLKDWKIWVEKYKVAELMKKNGEWGARTGKQVRYYGRKYYFNWFDNDAWKKAGVPSETRKAIINQNRKMCEKARVGFVEGYGGLGMPILSKEPLPDFNVSYGDYHPASIFSNGRQAQIEAVGKNWHWQKPLIVKNAWGLCQIWNRKENGWTIKEKNRKNYNKKKAVNTNIYQPSTLQQNYNELLNEYKENETFIKEVELKNIVELSSKTDHRPHMASTNAFFFFLTLTTLIKPNY